jgi:iron complex outermembrane receptor protein
METYEAGYIYRKAGVVARATIYYTKLRNMIAEQFNNRGEGRRPVNVDTVRVQGGELEWEQEVSADWKVMANLSYADAFDETNNHAIGGSANLLGNIAIKGKIMDDLLVAVRYLHVGDRNRDVNDPRKEKLSGYDTVDITLSYFNLGLKGLTLRAGVRNAFDADIKAPSMARTYVDDLPRPGSFWWAQIAKNF